MKITIEEVEIEDVEIIIRCSTINQDVQKIIHMLEQDNKKLQCKKDRGIYQIPIEDIYYIETIDEKSFVYLQDDVYENSSKLYELENNLKSYGFVRVSKSSLVNLECVHHIRALLNGKYEATLINQEKLIISRKYLPEFKKALEL